MRPTAVRMADTDFQGGKFGYDINDWEFAVKGV
jgi:hypothetical protein